MIILLLIALAALQALDGLTTRRILAQGGRELNPVMRFAFAKLGFWPAMALKGTGVLALAAWVAGQAGPIAPALLAVIYAAVVAWNWRQIS
ncbi:MAG: hypothetical protein IPG83_02390 [Novosphingobium sp.]|nr:hypothetical protein [Novosphingobium sp.]